MKILITGSSALLLTTFACQVFSISDNYREGMRIEEVLVTAQKKVEVMSHVPQAISAFDDSILDMLQVKEAGNLQFHIPNLTFSDTSSGAANLTLRGVGNTATIAGADSGVGIHINDVYINSGSLGGNFFDLQQVLVLRGPQGTLYGRNSTGGAINIITNRPNYEHEGYIESSVGSFGSRSVEGAVSIPISDSVRFRLAGLTIESDGYTKNEHTGNYINGEDAKFLRPTFSIDITDYTTLEIIGSYINSKSDSLGFDKIGCTRDDETALGCSFNSRGNDTANYLATIGGIGLEASGIVSEDPFLGASNPDDLFKTNIDFEPLVKDELMDILFNLEHYFGDMVFTSLTSVLDQRSSSRRDSDNLVGTTRFTQSVALSLPSKDLSGAQGGNIFGNFDTAFGYIESSSEERQYLQELRLVSDYDSAHNFQVGLFYMDTTIESEFVQATTGLDAYAELLSEFDEPNLSPYIYDQNKASTVQSMAGFGEYYYQHSESLKFTFGARWTRDDKDISHRILSFDFSAGDPIPGFDVPGLGVEREERYEALTGRIGVDWTPDIAVTDHTLLYGFLSRGYRSGGINNADSTGAPTYNPEFINSIEIGIKNTFFDGSAQLNLTAFYYDYKDYQVFQGSIFNADAKVWGIEQEYVQHLSDSFSFDLNASYLHTEVVSGSSINRRNPTASNNDFVAVGDIGANNCIVNRNTFESPLEAGGFDSDPFLPARNLQTCEQAGLSIGLPTNLTGNEFPNAPQWTAKLGMQYFNEVNDSQYLIARLDYYLQSSFYGRIFNDGADEVDSWKVLNMFVELGPLSDKGYYARLAVSNLLNEQHITGLEAQSVAEGLGTMMFALEPRTTTMSMGYKF